MCRLYEDLLGACQRALSDSRKEGVRHVSGPFHTRRVELCAAQREGDVLILRGEIDQANATAVTDRIVTAAGSGVVHPHLSRLTCSPVVLRMLQIYGAVPTEGGWVAPAEARGGRRPEVTG